MTARQELAWASRRLPPREAALLLQGAMGLSPTEFWNETKRRPSPEERRRFRLGVHARSMGHPMAYLLGQGYFWGMALHVKPGVLCPRPETEHLVEATLLRTATDHAVVVDVGCGSGAVALALKRERPGWRVVGTDVSRLAIEVAEANARAQGTDVRFFRGDLLRPLARAGIRPDVVVMNPPYIAPSERVGREVRFEPPLALLGGPDGLGVYRRLADAAAGLLAPGGQLIVEIGRGRASEVQAIVEARLGPSLVEGTRDLAGILRVLAFRTGVRAGAGRGQGVP